MLLGHELQPRGMLAAIVEVLRVSDGGDQRAGADRSDAGYGWERPSHWSAPTNWWDIFDLGEWVKVSFGQDP